MSRRPLIIVGAGGHGRVVADGAAASGYEVIAFAAEQAPADGTLFGVPVISANLDAIEQASAAAAASLIVAIGDNRTRQRLQRILAARGLALGTFVHPTALVSARAQIGPGSMLLAGCQVAAGSVIGAGTIINHAVSVDHDTHIGEFAHLSPGVHMGGEVTIGEGTHLAVGVSVRNRVRIGAWSIVGVGAAVVADVPDGVVAYGVPARVARGPSADGEQDR